MVAGRIHTKPAEAIPLTIARRVSTGLYRLVRLGNTSFTGLKIRCPKGRAGSTPALGTNSHTQLIY
jgi:hypothetical protein